MSPDVFQSLGQHGGGRLTKNKLRKAVSSVLGAWTNWSVYNSTFIDELENKFEGREVSANTLNVEEELNRNNVDDLLVLERTDVEKECISQENDEAISTIPRGTWTSGISVEAAETSGDVEGKDVDDLDGEEYDDEIDDKELEIDDKELEDVDGEELDVDDVDGEALDDIDGDEFGDDDFL